MSEKHKPKEPDKSQKERFKEAAKAVEADESEDALKRAFSKIDVATKKEG
jgi:hypothetical protein